MAGSPFSSVWHLEVPFHALDLDQLVNLLKAMVVCAFFCPTLLKEIGSHGCRSSEVIGILCASQAEVSLQLPRD